MSGSLLLETAKWRDVVELGLCMAIHDVCNDSQHRSDICADYATEDNQNYRKSIDGAIEEWRSRRRTP